MSSRPGHDHEQPCEPHRPHRRPPLPRLLHAESAHDGRGWWLRVGDAIEIVNRDDALHEVGSYTVGPGQTVRQTFTSPGTIEGVCTLHPAGAITIVVT